MALRFLTEDLVTSVKRRSLIPVSQTTFEDADIISLANEEMSITITPDIIQVREDAFLVSATTPIVGTVPDYKLPERAIGNAFKTLFYKTDNTNKWELPRQGPNKLHDRVLTGQPASFFLKDDYVSLSPVPSSSTGSLEFWYYRRPSELVSTANVGLVQSITTVGATTTLTLSNSINAVNGGQIDIYWPESPYTLDVQGINVSNVTSSSLDVATADIQDQAGQMKVWVGSYVALEKQSNVPLIPEEFHPVLAQCVAVKLLEALGDVNKLQLARQTLAEMRSQALKLITNRVETAVEYINNPYSISNSIGRYSRRSAIR